MTTAWLRFKNPFKLVRKRARYRFSIWLKSTFRRTPLGRPLFIVATRRSGSNLFASYLNSVPGVSIAGEMMNPEMDYGIRRRFITKRAVLRHIAHSVKSREGNVVGGKLMYTRLEWHKLALQDVVDRFPSAKFTILYRRSILDQFVSFKIAEMTDRWLWTPDFRLPRPFRVEPDELLSYARWLKSAYHKVLEFEADERRSLIVCYEDFASDPRGYFDRHVFPFLGLDPVPVSTGMKKQNSLSSEDLIVNFDDIRPLVASGMLTQNYLPLKVPII